MLLNAMVLFASGALAFHQGWTIPANHPNGVYSVKANADGTFEHTFIRDLILNYTYVATEEDLPFPSFAPTSAKFRNRDLVGPNNVGCGGYELVHSDTDTAVRNLDAQCGNGAFVLGGRDFYSISTGVVAYFCNFSGGSNNCYASERLDATTRITNNCGQYAGGWDVIPDRNCQYGYEGFPKNQFCGRGVSGR